MISEKIVLNLDLKKLQAHLEWVQKNYIPVMVGNHFGGWSVYSSDGDYRDGWARGEQAYSNDFMPGATLLEKFKALNIKKSTAYCHETEVCTGYLKEVMDQIKAMGLEPRRARLTLLKAQGQSSLHSDAPPEVYSVRLHIPIISNPECFFICDEGQEHFAASGEYGHLIFVNRLHQVVNKGTTDRVHLIMDVTDSSNVSQYHRR